MTSLSWICTLVLFECCFLIKIVFEHTLITLYYLYRYYILDTAQLQVLQLCYKVKKYCQVLKSRKINYQVRCFADEWPAELGNKCICVLYPLSKIVEDHWMNEQIHEWPLALFFCVPGMHSTHYGHLVQIFIGSPTTWSILSFLPPRHLSYARMQWYFIWWWWRKWEWLGRWTYTPSQ